MPDKDSNERAPGPDHKVNTDHDNGDTQLDSQRANAQESGIQPHGNITPPWHTPVQKDVPPNGIAKHNNPFTNNKNLPKLWENAIKTDDSYAELIQAVKKRDKKAPKSAGPGIILAKCSLDQNNMLRFCH